VESCNCIARCYSHSKCHIRRMGSWEPQTN